MNMTPRLRLPIPALVPLFFAFAVTTAWSHEGHDHGAPEPVTSDPSLVVRSASNDDYEVVLKYRTGRGQKSTTARVYLSGFATNAPVEQSRVTLLTTTPHQVTATAAAVSPGVYEASLPYEQAGQYTLILAIGSSPVAEFAYQNLPMGEDPAATQPARTPASRGWPSMWLMGAVLAALLVAVVLLLRRRSLRTMSRTALLVVAAAAGTTFWWQRSLAHEGHQHADQPAAAAPAGPSQPRYMPKESQFFLGIRTIIAQLESLRARINAVGHVVPESGALASVEAPRDGKLESVGRRLAVGDRVRQGQVIANLLVIDRLPIRAPISGLVAEVHFSSGQWVQAGDPLVVILDERQVRVELPLFGENLNRALRTREATVTTSALPGAQFPARVRGLAPTAPENVAGSESEAAAGSPIPPLLLTVTNRGGLLRPGMLVEVSLELPTAEELIAVPESAVIHQESGAVVFVHPAAEVFEQRAVRIVGRYGNRVGISGAVRPGDRIVVEGAQALVSAPPVATNAPADSIKGAP
jgi:multidrug efflux pump subunit AcrA (membrane-fusion protein)